MGRASVARMAYRMDEATTLMADRTYDTDPQSPRALSLRTDPGLGETPVVAPVASHPPVVETRIAPVVATPALPPAPESMEDLLDGITGPRPPPSRRDGSVPDGSRAYAAARRAPASRPMPPHEPAVVSMPPPPEPHPSEVPEAPEARRAGDADSTRPTTRRVIEARTVYTGRRAVVRNFAVVVGSAAVVTLMMMSILRWKEAQALKGAAAAAPPQLDTEAVVPGLAPAPGALTASPATVSATATTTPASPAASPAPKGSATATRRAKAGDPKAAPAKPQLDDLNREIKH